MWPCITRQIVEARSKAGRPVFFLAPQATCRATDGRADGAAECRTKLAARPLGPERRACKHRGSRKPECAHGMSSDHRARRVDVAAGGVREPAADARGVP